MAPLCKTASWVPLITVFVIPILLSSSAVACPLPANTPNCMTKDTAKVQCYPQKNCTGNGQIMTIRECCLSSNMFFYSTSNGCRECVAYGWLEESLEMEERDAPYYLRVGYIKGSERQTLQFRVIIEQNSTQYNVDYTVTPRQLMIDSNTATIVEVNTLLDRVALEPTEYFQLKLVLLNNTQYGVFRDTIHLSLIDNDAVEISLTSTEYRASEGMKAMTIGVTKSMQIATPLSLTITPQTANQAEISTDFNFTFFTIPETQASSPNTAIVIDDFDNIPIQVEFLPDLYSPVNDLTVAVSIMDDSLNEASEEYFYIKLDSNNPLVNVMGSRFSLCKIVDNDPFRLGFTNSSYTIPFSLADTEHETYIEIVTEDDRLSEQSFDVVVQAIVASPSPEIAALNAENIDTLLYSNWQILILNFASNTTAKIVHIYLDKYTIEDIRNQFNNCSVAFELVITGAWHPPYFLHANKLYQSTFIIME